MSLNSRFILVLFFNIFVQHLYKRGVVLAQIRCWDASLLPLANRTDSATTISSGMVTCANSATTCATSGLTGAGTCSTMAVNSPPTIANSIMTVYCNGLNSGNGCNQIASCWNPAASASVSCTNSGLSTGTNTFACYTTYAGVGSCYTSPNFTTAAGYYCFSTFCNAVVYKVAQVSGSAATITTTTLGYMMMMMMMMIMASNNILLLLV